MDDYPRCRGHQHKARRQTDGEALIGVRVQATSREALNTTHNHSQGERGMIEKKKKPNHDPKG